MRETARFTPSPTLDDDLRDMLAVQDGCVRVANRLKVFAEVRATPHIDTGEYIESLTVEARGRDGAALVAKAEHSDFVEWGTSSRRHPDAPTPTESPQKLGIRPQLILTGAIQDVANDVTA